MVTNGIESSVIEHLINLILKLRHSGKKPQYNSIMTNPSCPSWITFVHPLGLPTIQYVISICRWVWYLKLSLKLWIKLNNLYIYSFSLVFIYNYMITIFLWRKF